MLDASLLKLFCSEFFGYGTANADHWFISMEEGGGDSKEEIATRLIAWDKRGRRELEEIDEYHHAIGQGEWFSNRPPIQKTWAAAIRIILGMEGRNASIEDVRNYQRDHIARRGGCTRLSPLFPLPSRSLDRWNYADWSDERLLGDRKSYRRELAPLRIERLGASIKKLKPRTVTFFGVSYSDYWTQIAEARFVAVEQELKVAKKGATKFLICKHPATKGIGNSYFATAASTLRSAA